MYRLIIVLLIDKRINFIRSLRMKKVPSNKVRYMILSYCGISFRHFYFILKTFV